MKISWGYGLMTAFIIFSLLMFTLVYGSVRTRVNMVSDKYYEDELQYQQVLDKARNATKSGYNVKLEQGTNSLNITFPKVLMHEEIKGKISFYNSADSHNDKAFSLKIDSSGRQMLEVVSWPPGNYQAKIDWNYKGTEYYSEENLVIK